MVQTVLFGSGVDKRMGRSKLCISWVQRQFIAVSIAGGGKSVSWEAATPVTELSDFNDALAGAVEALNVKAGADVFIVYESDLLSHPLVPMTTMHARDRDAYLERKAQQQKTFEADAAWSFTKTLPSRDGTSVLLHLIPKTFVDALVRICEEFKLYPVSLLPLSDAMSLQIRSLSGDADEICMLLNLFPEQCEILVARGDGAILFVRDLGYNWVGNEDRLGLEVERSVLFAGQHFNVTISRMWISGLGGGAVENHLSSQVSMPVIALASDIPIDWVDVTATPFSQLHSNLIPHSIRNKRMLLWMFRGGTILVLLLMLLSAFSVWKVEMMIRDQGTHTPENIVNIDQWQHKKDELINKQRQLKAIVQRRRAFVATEIPAAAPVWFVKYIASILPDGMILSHISMQRMHERIAELKPKEDGLTGGWTFSIQGEFSHAGGKKFPQVLKAFETRLISQPLTAHITQSWRIDWLRQLRTGGVGNSDAQTFAIKGAIR